MSRPCYRRLPLALALATAIFFAPSQQPARAAASTKPTEPTWQAPKGSEVRRQLVEWLASRPAGEPTPQQVETDWATADNWTAEELLSRLADTIAGRPIRPLKTWSLSARIPGVGLT